MSYRKMMRKRNQEFQMTVQMLIFAEGIESFKERRSLKSGEEEQLAFFFCKPKQE